MGGCGAHSERQRRADSYKRTASGSGRVVSGKTRLVGSAGPRRAPTGGRSARASPQTSAAASSATEDVPLSAAIKPTLRRSFR